MMLSEIRLAAQQRADMVSSNFVSTAEWNSYINLAYYELYDILIQKYGADYFVQTPFAITTDGVNQLFALPTDFYKLLGVDIKTGNRWWPIKRFDFADRGRVSMNGSIPPAGQMLQAWYAPRLTELVNDTDTADGVDGWLEYVIVLAAAKALVKEETDASPLMAELQSLVARIEAAAENRDASQPSKVVDVYADYDDWYSGYNTTPPYLLRYRLNGNNLWVINAI
jgi:hypothetical protein